MSNSFEKAWRVVKDDDEGYTRQKEWPYTDYRPTYDVESGPKQMYIVIRWTDGKSLFLDGDSQKQILDEMFEAGGYSEMGVEDPDLMEHLFGIGSEWHSVADEENGDSDE